MNKIKGEIIMKKILALLMAITMLLALSATAIATDRDEGDATEIGTGSDLIPEFKDVAVWEVTVPTSLAFNFVLDPQGIYGMTAAQVMELDVDPNTNRLGNMVPVNPSEPSEGLVFEPLATAGQIIFQQGFAPLILNDSNRPTAVTFDFQVAITNGAGAPASARVTAVADPGTERADVNVEDVVEDNVVTTPAPANIFIGATFADNNVNRIPESFTGTQTLPITDDKSQPVFILEAAQYDDVIVATGDPVVTSVTVYRNSDPVENTGNGTQFILVGYCNPHADWGALNINGGNTDQDTNINITVGYSFAPPTGPMLEARDGDGDLTDFLHGLIDFNGIDESNFIERASGTVELLNADEVTADGAIRAATSAATNANTAADTLKGLVDAAVPYEGQEDNPNVQALDASLKGASYEALGTANEALTKVQEAIETARTVNLHEESPRIFGNLETARDSLVEAIEKLEAEMTRGQSLFNTVQEQAAIAATKAANDAKGDVEDAIADLQTLINYATPHKANHIHTTMAALRESLDSGAASGALATAQSALSDADGAIITAKSYTSDDEVCADIIADLETARDNLRDAIGALQAKMIEGNDMFVLGFVDEHGDTITQINTVAGAWGPPILFNSGGATIQTVQIVGGNALVMGTSWRMAMGDTAIEFQFGGANTRNIRVTMNNNAVYNITVVTTPAP